MNRKEKAQKGKKFSSVSDVHMSDEKSDGFY